jgi:hypothetical protein
MRLIEKKAAQRAPEQQALLSPAHKPMSPAIGCCRRVVQIGTVVAPCN